MLRKKEKDLINIRENIEKKLIKGFVVFTFFLFLLLLGKVFRAQNVDIVCKREENELNRIYANSYIENQESEAPIGLSREFHFLLNTNVVHDTSFCFYTAHEYAKVYIGDECIYELKQAKELSYIKTPGYNWINIPIYAEDIGKELKVVIYPVYKNVSRQEKEFWIGPQYKVILQRLKQSWGTLMAGELLVFTGILLLMVSFYFIWKTKSGTETTAFGFFAILMGIWRYTDTSFSPFMLEQKPVFLFMSSFMAMMFGMIPIMISQGSYVHRVIKNSYIMIISVTGIIAVICQWNGLADVRDFIYVFHIIGAIGLIIILCSLIIKCIKEQRIKKNRKDTEDEVIQFVNLELLAFIILTAGMILDAVFFYFGKSSSRTAFVLWALIFYIIVSVFSFTAMYIRQKKIAQKKSEQLIISRIGAMMGQIRSHFVFNILNAISGMCKYDAEKADETIVCFSRYLRSNIDIMQNDEPIPFKTALKHIEDYIQLEQIRFGDKIKFLKNIEYDDFLIPPLTMQPILENAIKHGLLPKEEGGTIILSVRKENEHIKLIIEDNGIGFDVKEKKDKSIGLNNVRLRLEYMMNGKLDIGSRKGKGTIVVLTFPIRSTHMNGDESI